MKCKYRVWVNVQIIHVRAGGACNYCNDLKDKEKRMLFLIFSPQVSEVYMSQPEFIFI